MPYLREHSLSLIFVLSASLVLGEMATDIFISALPTFTEDFGASVSLVQLTLASYMVGFGLMQLIYGPLSDRWGRKRPLLVGNVIFLVSSLLASQSDSIEVLIVLRFCQSLGGAAGITICLAIVRDLYSPQKSAVMLARIGTIMALGPAIAPVLGGILVEWASWRWTFYFLALWAMITTILIYYFVPESLKKKDRTALHARSIIQNFLALLKNRQYVGYLTILSFMLSGFFAFMFGAPFVFIDIFGLSESTFPLLITLMVGGFMIGTLSVEHLIKKFSAKRVFYWGVFLAWLSSVAVAFFPLIGLQAIETIIGPMIVFSFAMGFIFPLGTAGALTPFPRIAGTASALLGFAETVSGVFFGILVGVFFDKTAISMTSLISIAATIGLICYFIFLLPAGSLSESSNNDSD